MEENVTNPVLTSDIIVVDIYEVLVLIIAFCGMFINVATILALMHLPWSARPNLRLLASLCVANIIFAFNFLLYMIAYYQNPEGSGYAFTCLFYEIVRCIIYLFVFLNVTSIVIDLYISVTNPLGYSSIVTKARTTKLLCINGIISLSIAGIAVLFNYLTMTDCAACFHESSCSIYVNYIYIRSFNWIFKVSIFICIPVFIVLLIIIFLAVKATNSSSNSNSQPSNSCDVNTVIFVVFLFILSFGPYQFISFYIQYSPETYADYATTAKILEMLYYVYGFCTPLFYSLRMTDVKKGYTLMFKKCWSAAADYHSVFTGN